MCIVFSCKNSQLAVHPQLVVLKISGTTGHIVAKTCNMSTRYHKPPLAGVHQYTLINVQLTASATSREGKGRYGRPVQRDPNARYNYLLYKETDFLRPKYWHGYVLHEGTAYHGRVPRISQMTSRLLRHTAAAMRAHNVLCNSYLRYTAAAMRAHNVLCNSYNSWDGPLQLSSCTFCVVVHSYSFENCMDSFVTMLCVSVIFCTVWYIYIYVLCVRHIHDPMLLP
jgi:hypothetical protein